MNSNLQNILHTEIPLTKSIGIEIAESTDLSLSLSAPLDNNINHKCTAFGGSLYSISVLSGWGLIFLQLKQHGLAGHIVIQESHTQFIKPVTSTIISRCSFENQGAIDKFISMYKRKGIARIQLESRIEAEQETCVIFSGRYVVHQ